MKTSRFYLRYRQLGPFLVVRCRRSVQPKWSDCEGREVQAYEINLLVSNCVELQRWEHNRDMLRMEWHLGHRISFAPFNMWGYLGEVLHKLQRYTFKRGGVHDQDLSGLVHLCTNHWFKPVKTVERPICWSGAGVWWDLLNSLEMFIGGLPTNLDRGCCQ